MAQVVVVGGGLIGLSAGMLLARDGHDVTVLERDPASPPDPAAAWQGWERTGVTQFRLPHFLLARFRVELERELPDVAAALEAVVGPRTNALDGLPAVVTGGERPGDEAYASITGRRPVVEAVVAGAAGATPGLTVRRGVGVGGLHVATTVAGAPVVGGVVTDTGEVVAADVVVDAGGRRSALARWLAAAGGPPCAEDAQDSGFAYYGRHLTSDDGSRPVPLGPPLQHYGSVSTLTLPADAGTWAVVLVLHAGDAALRGLRRAERWEAAVRAFPLVAHWLEGRYVDDRVTTMAKIEDRRRSLVVDGRPVAGGVLLVADAWACTNPSLGRGATMGLMHAVALRDYLRAAPSDPLDLVVGWEACSEERVGPYVAASLAVDRARLAEADAALVGRPAPAFPEAVEFERCLQEAAGQDPDVLRGLLDVAHLLAPVDEVAARPGLAGRVRALGGGWRDRERPGPDRATLVALAGGGPGPAGPGAR